MTLIVHATNIHSGGGLTLLRTVLGGVPSDQRCILLADTRLDTRGLPPHVEIRAFAPSLLARFAGERHLRELATPEDVVLCLGNLPPLLANRAHVVVYLGNRYLCDDLPLDGFSPVVRLRLSVERQWLRRRLAPSMRLAVQTDSMRRAVRRSLGRDAEVLPVVNLPEATTARATPDGHARFLYPASGEPHKNHATLLDAWRLLTEGGDAPELHLTVDDRAAVAALVAKATREGLRVVNHGVVTATRMAELYAASSALIYPSFFESFGLPLLEASAAGLPIVAAERDYVRDVVEPAETFDPTSAVSIARAVRRHLGRAERPRTPLTPGAFVRAIVEPGRGATSSS